MRKKKKKKGVTVYRRLVTSRSSCFYSRHSSQQIARESLFSVTFAINAECDILIVVLVEELKPSCRPVLFARIDRPGSEVKAMNGTEEEM